MLVEASGLGARVKRLADESGVKMKVWLDALPTLDRRAIAAARLDYEETIAMWMDAHERLSEILVELVARGAK